MKGCFDSNACCFIDSLLTKVSLYEFNKISIRVSSKIDNIDGSFDCKDDGYGDFCFVGAVDEDLDGKYDGSFVGIVDRTLDGKDDCGFVGGIDWNLDGKDDGNEEGEFVGFVDVSADGKEEGIDDVGSFDGSMDGEEDGDGEHSPHDSGQWSLTFSIMIFLLQLKSSFTNTLHSSAKSMQPCTRDKQGKCL